MSAAQRAMRDVLQLLLSNFDEAYEKKAWHGPNLRGALRGVRADDAVRRTREGSHTIWELTAHAAYWKTVARRRLLRLRGATGAANWIVSPDAVDERAWRELVRTLDREHRALREAIAFMTDADLRDAKKLRLITGVTAHDVYHAGQIQLVKRLLLVDR